MIDIVDAFFFLLCRALVVAFFFLFFSGAESEATVDAMMPYPSRKLQVCCCNNVV